ncbi:glycosyltransferase family 24 protein [Teratosphaeria destructans]|uniref:Glycosyltransferase family 24 protein n=1 Tax=Teratosphaeria destructans TaxID=418781 RepID=A0A9W7W4L6_9PEZI|nr:glycosyltransferase family 24 protein [Teratosphaeria destructans]
MRTYSWLALGAGLASNTLATPSVNVGLRAAFHAPPYLVELLETAAEENATAYFPLLDRISDGYFDSAKTQEELYTKFREVLQQDGHLSQPEALASFDFAMSIHSAAPRIEAHFQYYKTVAERTLGVSGDGEDCETWVYVPYNGEKYCSPDVAAPKGHGEKTEELHQLPFDRVLGDGLPSVLYADISSESFRKFHKTISKTAREGKTSYRVRYKPATDANDEHLTVSGYGVELALKRTDYIVIDDRQAEEQNDAEARDGTLSEEDVSDLRPLSASELLKLGLKASSFVMASHEPFDTLVKLSQDFPKHSGAIAATSVSDSFLQEHMANHQSLLPAGFNVMWINGVQIMGRDIDVYALLEHLRHERKMINGVRELGLTAPQAIDLLSHEAVTAASVDDQIQRYDWRDDLEGGDVIMWLNDIEKDRRYADWPSSITAFLQRTYPGQLPPVRKDAHQMVLAVDFADYGDVAKVVDNIQNFVRRKIPMKFGLVPKVTSGTSTAQAKVVYYLLDRYGLSVALDYLSKSVVGAGRKYGLPQEKYFTSAISDKTLRGADKFAMDLNAVLDSDEFHGRIKSAQLYIKRLGGGDELAIVNGVVLPSGDEWLQGMSMRVSTDLREVQRAVYEGDVSEETWLPELWLVNAASRRNPVVVPKDDKDIRHIDLGDLAKEVQSLPHISASQETVERELAHLTLIADADSFIGFSQAMEAMLFQRDHDNMDLALLRMPAESVSGEQCITKLAESFKSGEVGALLEQFDALAGESQPDFSGRQALYKQMCGAADKNTQQPGSNLSREGKSIVSAVGVRPGEQAFVLNGRVVGPFTAPLEVDDLETLLTYERKKRLLPAAFAIEALGLQDKAKEPVEFARISNLIALSQISDVPEGIFEAAPTVRTGIFKSAWQSTHTAIKTGDMEAATVQIFAAIDPASEVAQKWIPILKALSELDGVATTLFLNPKDRLEELPIKRFYRYVLEPKPSFEPDGSLKGLSARFSGLPADALLNMGMELPPSWLVAPKDSIHDLDNIKLSALKSGTDIEATYELEHILIEGHSRDITLGPPPRGAQLVLQTEQDPHFADTIIMANLGYFQFKANPGIYNLTLQKGRSGEIFNIDSAGTLGYTPVPGDNGTEIALTSFRGATLFPRLSRKPGMEEEDVLETEGKSVLDGVAEGAEKLLGKIGLSGHQLHNDIQQASKYLQKIAKLGTSLLGANPAPANLKTDPQAEINIFSVASGHLYERMLNIMMVSVMKHTKHTVKFWFIEQFLSPSFKEFLPTLAEEYGFKYEMVTYKWPHWLRGQKEKQREIWGYKILFLDVLFPLDLDKVIFVDADQIVRTDMYELVQHDLKGAPYGFTPMCDSRTEMEGFRFWKQGYWKNFLRGLPYHISALYVVDLKKFRQIAAGDRLRQQYHQLSADPASLSNLDQDLPNHMQTILPIHSLPQEWLWCETWCSDEALKDAKTIDLCNNPQTKEPKLDRARRQVPEWTVYDDEIAAVAKRHKEGSASGRPVAEKSGEAGMQGMEGESVQERLQREDAEREARKAGRDEL